MIRMSDPQATDPTEYAELRAVIVGKYPSLSPQHKEIAEFALSNPEVMAVETAAQIAERLKMQPSSLVRWAQALGFPGLKELKRRFRSQLIYKAVDARDQAAAVAANTDNGSIGILDASSAGALPRQTAAINHLIPLLSRHQMSPGCCTWATP